MVRSMLIFVIITALCGLFIKLEIQLKITVLFIEKVNLRTDNKRGKENFRKNKTFTSS